jgi:predicted alpha/beta hydrolase family esterase
MVIDCISDYKKIVNQNPKTNPLKDIFLSDSIDKFKITKHRDGNYPAIITISGWRTQDKDNRKDWEESILEAYPDREWFHLEWNSNKIPIIDRVPMSDMPDVFEEQKVKKSKYLKFIKYGIYRYNLIANGCDILINNYWHGAVRNSKNTGDCLAKVLSSCQKKEFILIGHSLGARVIFNCLNYLYENQFASNIFEVHLLGGAVGSNSKKWSQKTLLVKNNLYNYFSNNDSVLKTSYRASMLTSFPVGLTKIVNEKVINKDSTRLIKGHSEYIKNFNLLKNNIIPVETL